MGRDLVINMTDVERGFAAMKRRADTVRTVFQALKRPAAQDHADHAARAMGPDGPWPRRSRATLAKLEDRAAVVRVSRRRRTRTHRGTNTKITTTVTHLARARELLGSLPRSMRFTASAKELKAASGIRRRGLAEVHNSGGTAGRGARIPRRTYIYWSERFTRLASEAIETHVFGGWDPSIRLKRLSLSL